MFLHSIKFLIEGKNQKLGRVTFSGITFFAPIVFREFPPSKRLLTPLFRVNSFRIFHFCSLHRSVDLLGPNNPKAVAVWKSHCGKMRVFLSKFYDVFYQSFPVPCRRKLSQPCRASCIDLKACIYCQEWLTGWVFGEQLRVRKNIFSFFIRKIIMKTTDRGDSVLRFAFLHNCFHGIIYWVVAYQFPTTTDPTHGTAG